jgi:hypothetical protein
LAAPEESRVLDGKLETGGILFAIYPNTGHVVKPGVAVSVHFGETRLQAMAAR